MGKLEAELLALAREELVWNLDEDAGAVAGFGIAAAGAAMRQVEQHLDSLADDVVAFLAADAGDKPDAAGVVLVRRVVETLGGRQAILGFRRVVMDFVRWTEFLPNHLFLGVACEGDGASHTSAQEQTVRILMPMRTSKVQCRISMQAMQISGRIQPRWIPSN